MSSSKSPQLAALLACLAKGAAERDEAIAAITAAGADEETARKCIGNAITRGLIGREIVDGHTRYVANGAAGATTKPARWRGSKQRKPAQAKKRRRAAEAAPRRPLEAKPDGEASFALFSDGSVLINCKDGGTSLCADDSLRLIAFLRRVGAIREPA